MDFYVDLDLSVLTDEDLAFLYCWTGCALYYAGRYELDWFMGVWETVQGQVEVEICKRFCERCVDDCQAGEASKA